MIHLINRLGVGSVHRYIGDSAIRDGVDGIQIIKSAGEGIDVLLAPGDICCVVGIGSAVLIKEHIATLPAGPLHAQLITWSM